LGLAAPFKLNVTPAEFAHEQIAFPSPSKQNKRGAAWAVFTSITSPPDFRRKGFSKHHPPAR